MYGRLIIDGNAVYEIDEECLKKKEIQGREKPESGRKNPYQQDRKPCRKG